MFGDSHSLLVSKFHKPGLDDNYQLNIHIYIQPVESQIMVGTLSLKFLQSSLIFFSNGNSNSLFIYLLSTRTSTWIYIIVGVTWPNIDSGPFRPLTWSDDEGDPLANKVLSFGCQWQLGATRGPPQPPSHVESYVFISGIMPFYSLASSQRHESLFAFLLSIGLIFSYESLSGISSSCATNKHANSYERHDNSNKRSRIKGFGNLDEM